MDLSKWAIYDMIILHVRMTRKVRKAYSEINCIFSVGMRDFRCGLKLKESWNYEIVQVGCKGNKTENPYQIISIGT